ncbi:MAG: hypothetical protein EHM42_14745 [Planctomycetaceae bacterium]|nr:MAG: hypothetical protein EHM42_14745 [Planctomycetaceae bacterium]
MLTLAGLFHLGVWATMHVGDFSPTMLVLLLAFIEPHELARFWQGSTIQSSDRSEALPGAAPVADGAMRHEAAHAPEKPPSRALRSFGTYLLTAAGVVLAGTGLQWWFDWYGVFGNRRMQPLDEAPAVVAEVMQTRRKPAFEDYVHRIALGTWRGERDVLGDGQRVRIGERLHVLVQFVVPHPDLKLEGLLLASDGRLAARFEHKLDAGYSYAINGFELTAELPTGTSRVILQIDGYEIASRKIEIEAAL